jgi:hypothetical protein
METLADLVAAGRERDGTAVEVAGRTTPYSYRELCTNVWKAANLLGHYGVHPGGDVAVIPGPKEAASDDWPEQRGLVDSADPLLAILGGTLPGATVTTTPAQPVQSRALVLPAGWWAHCETTPRCSALAYGGPPEDPQLAHFEAELWSENPTQPPEQVDPETPALRADGQTHSHGALLAAATTVTDRYGLDESSRVGLTATLDAPAALVAGVLAPLSVGATVVLAPDPAVLDSEDATLVVADDTDGQQSGTDERVTVSELADVVSREL